MQKPRLTPDVLEALNEANKFLDENLDDLLLTGSDLTPETKSTAVRWLDQFIAWARENGVDSSDYDGNECPHCKSTDIEGGHIEGQGADQASFDLTCTDCGSTWTEWYDLTGYTNLVTPDDETNDSDD